MLICMRTTLNLNDDLVRQAKLRAAMENRTLTSVIEDALRRLLSGQVPADPVPYRVQTTFASDLQPGLDPKDPVFYKQIFEQDDIEKYGPQSQLHGSTTDATV